jgi:hypothetical protein
VCKKTKTDGRELDMTAFRHLHTREDSNTKYQTSNISHTPKQKGQLKLEQLELELEQLQLEHSRSHLRLTVLLR